MSRFGDFVNQTMHEAGDAFIPLACSAAGDWTDRRGTSVGTTTTSGIYKIKKPGAYMCTSAAADAAAIVYLPAAASCPLQMVLIYAPTGATGGDISVYDEETGAEITTLGDMDADGDRAIWISTGLTWVNVVEVVA